MATIQREGVVHFHDASLSVVEEGIADAREAGGFKGAQEWERKFKRDVFLRIVQKLNRMGWSVKCPPIDPLDVKHYGGTVARRASERRRKCKKGDLQGELIVTGRSIKFEMWQGINTPTRPDHGGRYESNKEAIAPYPLRLEMIRTRRNIRDYLCGVFENYTFSEPIISSPNPDPLAYFNDDWDGEYEKRRGTHRFKRGPDGWPDDSELRSWDRKDKDGIQLSNGAIRWLRTAKGHLLRGRVYGGINGRWLLVYGPGPHDYRYADANEFFTYTPDTPRKEASLRTRQNRIKEELDKAVKAMNFERAIHLRDALKKEGV